MTRSTWKIPYKHKSLDILMSKSLKNQPRKTIIKVWDRSSTITSNLLNLNVEVYNGQKFLPVVITQEMVGHKLGEFAFTRKRCTHKKKTKKK